MNRIRLWLYRLRYLRASERKALSLRLAQACTAGVISQAAAYETLRREVPFYAYFAVRDGFIYSFTIYTALIRWQLEKAGEDRDSLAYCAGAYAQRRGFPSTFDPFKDVDENASRHFQRGYSEAFR